MSSSSLVPDQQQRAERSLDVLNFVLADVRYGLGPYAIVYLIAGHSWDEARIALAFSFGSIAGLLTQTPIGAMVDVIRAKRALAAMALLAIATSCATFVLAPSFWPVTVAGVAGALANSTLGTTVAAISLGIVGPNHLARRAARNEVMFHAGSGAVNLMVLAAAPVFGITVAFWLLTASVLASLAALWAVPAGSIQHRVARGLTPDDRLVQRPPAPLATLLANRSLLAFALCGALFHMANSSMLALVVQRAALMDAVNAVPLAAACMIAAQIAMVGTAALCGTKADIWGRKPFFLGACAALTLRGVLYTLSDAPAWTVAVQLLDGVGVGIFGALFPVVVSDLTRGGGHFNAAQGAVGTMHAIGGLVGGPLSAACVVWGSYDAAFVALAGTAALAGVAFYLLLPETRPIGVRAS